MHCPVCKTPLMEDGTDSFEVGIQAGVRRSDLPPEYPEHMREPAPSWMTTWWLCFGCMDAEGSPWPVLRGDGHSEPVSTFTYMGSCVFCKGSFRVDRHDAFEIVLRGPKTKFYEYPEISHLPPDTRNVLSRSVKVPAWQSFSSVCAGCIGKIHDKWKTLIRPMDMDDFENLGPLPYAT